MHTRTHSHSMSLSLFSASLFRFPSLPPLPPPSLYQSGIGAFDPHITLNRCTLYLHSEFKKIHYNRPAYEQAQWDTVLHNLLHRMTGRHLCHPVKKIGRLVKESLNQWTRLFQPLYMVGYNTGFVRLAGNNISKTILYNVRKFHHIQFRNVILITPVCCVRVN